MDELCSVSKISSVIDVMRSEKGLMEQPLARQLLNKMRELCREACDIAQQRFENDLREAQQRFENDLRETFEEMAAISGNG
jgi:hypothetical protein